MCSITPDMLKLLGGGAEQTPKYQTEFELFAIFLSVKFFARVIHQPFAFFVRSDNTAALRAALEYRSKSPLLVQLTIEVMLEAHARDWPRLQGRHIQGLLNDTADLLSRGEVPPCLTATPRVSVGPFDCSLFRAWPDAD